MAKNRRRTKKAKQKAESKTKTQESSPKADPSAKQQAKPNPQEVYASLPFPYIGVLIPRAYTQTENTVAIRLALKGIQNHPVSDIEIILRSLSLEVNIKNFNGGHLVTRIYQLYGSINKKESTFVIGKDEIILELKKDPPKYWFALHQCPFIQSEMFHRKMLETYKASSPVPGLDIDKRQQFEEVIPDYPDVAVEMDEEEKVFTEDDETNVTDSFKKGKRKKSAVLSDEKFREKIHLYSKAISQYPLCSSNYLKRSKLYFNHLNVMKSRQDLLQYVKLRPFGVEVYIHLAISFIATFKIDHADSCCRFARTLVPYRGKMRSQIDHLSVYLQDITLFKISVEQNKLKQAMDHLKKVLKNVYFTPCSVRNVTEILCVEKRLESVKTIINGLSKGDFPEKQDYECEIIYLQSLLAYYEDDDDSFNRLSQKYLASNPTDLEALEKYKGLSKIYSLRKEGDTYLAERNFPEAVKFYTQVQKLQPNSAVASTIVVRIAEAKLKQGLVDEVIADMTLAIGKNKDSHECYAKRGECHLAHQSFNKAVNDFKKANLLFPCDHYQNMLYKTIGAKKKAKEIQKAAVVTPEPANTEKIKTGNSILEENVVSSDQKNPPVVLSSTQEVNCKVDDREEKISSNNIPKETIVNDGSSLLAKAKHLNAFGSPKKAIKILNKARKQCYEKEQVLKCYEDSLFLIMKIKFGDEAMGQRDFERALEKFESASKIAVFDSSICVKRAECLLSLHRVKEVKELIESIPSEIETESNIFYVKGLYEHHIGNFESSIDLLSNAITKDSKNKKAIARLALIKLIYKHVKETES